MKNIIVFMKFLLALTVMYLMYYHYDEVMYEAERLVRSLASQLMTTIKSLIH